MTEILEKLEDKKKEAERFVLKYKTRRMPELEEYYKGAKWALEFAINTIKEE